jgi:hypothetical protein
MNRACRQKGISPFYFTIILAVLLGLMSAGCSRTKRVKEVRIANSGFLPDYSLLEPGEPGQALLRYQNPKADWPSYKKILIDPVLFWSRTDALPDATPRQDLQRLANNFDQMINNAFGKDYEIVEEPGPRTLRLQVALTNIEQPAGAVDVITAAPPVGYVLSSAQEFVTGKPMLVGEVSAEVKVSDARTGQILSMAIDQRLGSKTIVENIDTWDDANRILALWAEFVRFRLCQLRGGADCYNPEVN